MALALFDLDNTLLNGDSDYQWGEFLVKKGLVDPILYKKANDLFYQQYKAGSLDINKFLDFSLAPLKKYSKVELDQWHQEFMQTLIKPLILPAALALVEAHRQAGDTLMVITATNQFVTKPIVQCYGIDLLIASEPELIKGEYTGKVTGIPSFQEGKVKRLEQWLKENNQTLENSWFYSDSINDLPLLEKVTNPVAVDADQLLLKKAKEQGWAMISLRQNLN